MKTIRLYDSCADYELAVDGSVEGSSLPKNSICYCKDAKKVCYNLKIVGTTDKTEPFNLYINGIDKATYKSKAQQVSVKDGFFELGLTSKPYDAYRMFGGDSLDANHTPIGDAWNVKSVIRLDGVDNLKNLSYMFQGCVSLGYVNCGDWDTSKVTNIKGMFNRCSGLTALDVSGWNTSNVIDMSGMFNNCSGLTTLDVSNWDTSKVTDMRCMFSFCSGLTNLNVSSWNTNKVTDMSAMFQGCSGLTTIDVSKWTTNNVTNMSYMFNLCSSLTALDVSGWDTSKVTDMSTMFQVCSGLTNLDVSDWNTSNVTNMERLFNVCSGLTEIDVSNWNTSKVTNMECMFLQCRNVKMLDVSKWDVSKVTKFAEMFGECYSLTELDLSGWDLSSCEEDDVHLFSDIQGSENRRNGDLTTIKLGKGFFKAKTKEYTSANLTTINWSRESMMESLYTNQIGRDVTDVKNLYLRPEPLSRLSEEDIAKIKSVGIILIKATSGG